MTTTDGGTTTTTVHPHICGVNVLDLNDLLPGHRFIPTYVGLIAALLRLISLNTVHPHVCGVNGTAEAKKIVMEFVKSEDCVFDFEKIVPMPDYIYRGVLGVKEQEIYGEDNWYDWSNKNWGTKWNSVDAEERNGEINFLTAWSPCDPVIAALAEKFPALRITYTFYEPGMRFCGKRVYENGEVIFYYDGD